MAIKENWIYVALVLLAFPIIFVKLDSFSMRVWDEAIYAVNVYEMLSKNELIVPFFNGTPDLLNNKPPLALWAQMASVKILGYNPLAIRIPSAISAMLTILVVYGFVKRQLGQMNGFLAAFVLITSYGFVTFHTARTGDTDAIMTFFVTIANLTFLSLITRPATPPKLTYLFFGMLILAFWTKSVASLLFIPGYLFLTFYFKKGKTFLSDRHIVIGAIFALLLFGAFFILRQQGQPGYLDRFFLDDAGRLFHEVDQHRNGFFYYVWKMFTERFSFWLPLALVGIVFSFQDRHSENGKWLFGVSILVLFYWFIISFSATKLPWYDMSLYPLLAILCAYGILRLMSALTIPKLKPVLLIALFALPFSFSFSHSQSNTFSSYEEVREAKEKFIHTKLSDGVNLNGLHVYEPGMISAVLFYKYWMRDLGHELNIISNNDVEMGDKVLILKQHIEIFDGYKWSIEDGSEHTLLIKIE